MTPRDFRNIHTTENSCRDALPYANMALKLPRVDVLTNFAKLKRKIPVLGSFLDFNNFFAIYL